mmetsp:Transcript_1953/g.2882  ORF Transcript_1953/g.2882 Transcript_1953/m.2882 type:complete len:200 (-) Transcript_1953:63-662(-)
MPSMKSSCLISAAARRRASMPASTHTALSCAPLKSSQLRPSSSKFTSSLSTFIFREWICRMRARASSVGCGNSILRSSRPGRSSAGSSVSGRFVHMITLTLVAWSKPSIWFSSSSRMRCTSRSAPVWASKRLVAMASISSMNTMAGAFSRASRNTSRTMRGPSPRYFCTNSDPTMEMNAAVVEFATALAIIVLPVPGGP